MKQYYYFVEEKREWCEFAISDSDLEAWKCGLQ